MILVFLTVSCALFGSSCGTLYESVCYGKSVWLPYHFTLPTFTGRVYFIPSKPGPKKLVMDRGEVLDPRLKVYSGKVYFTELTEKDDGRFAIALGDRLQDVFRLETMDCTKQISRLYGHTLEYDVPGLAEFLEFNPIRSLDQSMILWNRSNPQVNVGKRGEVKKNVFKIFRPTQADNGYYSFREKDNSLESRLQLTVTENHKYASEKEDETISINYPWTGDGPWTVTYTPKQGGERITVIREGAEIWKDGDRFSGRIYARRNAIEILYLEYEDAGIFDFRDPEGHLALTVHLNIISETHKSSVYIHFALGIAGLVVFGCCSFCFVKNCCLKDKFTTQTSAAPARFSHGVNPTTDPRPSNARNRSAFPHQTVNSAVSKRPTRTSVKPQVTPPAHQVPVPAPSSFNFLTSDTEPRFELKGLPSATLLSSDTPCSDVYMSDKLDFL